jgi:hypothetical protein
MDEKEALKIRINQKLSEKGRIVVDTSISDEKFILNLLDVCTLNQLRDVLDKQGGEDG